MIAVGAVYLTTQCDSIARDEGMVITTSQLDSIDKRSMRATGIDDGNVAGAGDELCMPTRNDGAIEEGVVGGSEQTLGNVARGPADDDGLASCDGEGAMDAGVCDR